MAYGLDGDEHTTLCALQPSLKATKDLVGRYYQAQEVYSQSPLATAISPVAANSDEPEPEQVDEEGEDEDEDASSGNQQTLF